MLAVLMALGAAGCTKDTVHPDGASCGPDGWRFRDDPTATAALNPSEIRQLLEGDTPDAVRNLDGDGTSADDMIWIDIGPSDMTFGQAESLGRAAAAGMTDYPEVAKAAAAADVPAGWVRFRMAVDCQQPSLTGWVVDRPAESQLF